RQFRSREQSLFELLQSAGGLWARRERNRTPLPAPLGIRIAVRQRTPLAEKRSFRVSAGRVGGWRPGHGPIRRALNRGDAIGLDVRNSSPEPAKAERDAQPEFALKPTFRHALVRYGRLLAACPLHLR